MGQTSNLVNLNQTPYSSTPQINVTSSPYGTSPGLVSSSTISPTNIPIPGVSTSSLSPQGGIQGSAGSTGIMPAPKISTTGISGIIPPPTPAPTQTPNPSPQIGGGALTPEQIANSKTPEEIAKATGQNPPTLPNTTPGTPGGPQYNAGNITYPGLVAGAANMSSQPSDIFKKESDAALGYQKQLSDLGQEYAKGTNQISGSPGLGLQEASGQQGLLNSLYAQKEGALAGAFQGASSLLPSATGQQNAQIAGTLGAAGLSAPQNSNQLGTYNPLNPGQYTGYGGGSVDPNNPSAALFNAGGIGGTMSLGAQYTGVLQPAYRAAGAILNDPQNGMDAFLKQNPDINPDTLRIGNQLQQWVQGQMSDPKLSAFNQKLNEFLSTATPLVGAMGGMTNFKQSMVNSMLDSMAQGQSVSQAMHTMYDLMGAKLNAIAQNGGSGTTSGSSGGASTIQGNTLGISGNFSQDSSGKWIYTP